MGLQSMLLIKLWHPFPAGKFKGAKIKIGEK
jgi:hypothetical protein